MSTQTNRRFWRIRAFSATYDVIRRADLQEDEVPLSPRFAQVQVELWVRDPLLWTTLVDISRSLLGFHGENSNHTGVQWLEGRLKYAFQHKQLLLIEPGRWQDWHGMPLSAGSGGSSQQNDGSSQADNANSKANKSASAQKSSPPEPKPPEKTWFRARLLDEDGQPMVGEDYVLIDSDGAKRTGKLDSNGEIYVPPLLMPGNCTISFPNIHLNPLKKKAS